MMQHITGIPRNQMFFSSLEDTILPENPVRFIDAFVEALSLKTLGFSVQTIKTGGRPVLTPIKQEYYSKFRFLITLLIFSSLLSVYQSSIFP
jgi:hypothetical protein